MLITLDVLSGEDDMIPMEAVELPTTGDTSTPEKLY